MTVTRNPNLDTFTAREAPELAEFWRRNLGHSEIDLGMPRSRGWWTGLPPSQCPGVGRDGKLRSLTIPNLATCTRSQVRDYFNNSWTLTELLFSSLIGDQPFYRPPYHGLRHPLIFYYVHPAVLYVNKLRVAKLAGSINPEFESLFETGVDEMSWDDMSKNEIEWPTVDAAWAYRKLVYSLVLSIVDSHPDLADGHAPISQEHPLWALFMGFEHERIHLETSSVLIRELPVHLVSRPPEWPTLAPHKNDCSLHPPLAGRDYPENRLLSVAAQTVQYGKEREFPTFGWDNEYGSRSVRPGDFAASSLLISNGEFWQFVACGGYVNRENWSESGWRWRSFRNVKFPTFWVPSGPAGSLEFKLRTCFEVIEMQWDFPAVVNYHEAKAYCIWKSRQEGREFRLLTEAEHHCLRKVSPVSDNNLNLQTGSESRVDGDECAAFGFSYVFGNVWQWCEDHFNPLEGSRIHPFYDDFSTPCYDGQHQMILGGSFISTGAEATPHARFHFRPHFFQHAGFRIVSTEDGGNGCVVHLGETPAMGSPYQSDDYFNEYMTAHYGDSALQMPWASGPLAAVSFPRRCAELLSRHCEKLSVPQNRALDIGCAVGAATFSLAKTFDHVTGVDLSERFIEAARALKKDGQLAYRCKVEGELYSDELATVSLDAAGKTEFRQADASCLPAEYKDFDAVLIANLLCRLPSPGALLGRLGGSRGLVRAGGLLLIISPYSWSERFTPRDVWLGGYRDEKGETRFSEDGLKEALLEHFELLEAIDIPLVIREHRRKFQYIVSQGMLWRRR